MKSAIIYSRVSTRNQDNDRQITELYAYAKEKGYTVVNIFSDTISGKTKVAHRKAAKQLLSYLLTNQIDLVMVWELSRLGRSLIDILKVTNQIVDELKINVYLRKENLIAYLDDGSKNKQWDMNIGLMGSFSQYEVSLIQERTQSAIDKLKKDYSKYNEKHGLAPEDENYKRLGRPNGSQPIEQTKNYKKIVRCLKEKLSIRKTAKIADVAINTVRKVDKHLKNSMTGKPHPI